MDSRPCDESACSGVNMRLAFIAEKFIDRNGVVIDGVNLLAGVRRGGSIGVLTKSFSFLTADLDDERRLGRTGVLKNISSV